MAYWYVHYNANGANPVAEEFTDWLPAGFRPPRRIVVTLHGLSPASTTVASKIQISPAGTVITSAIYSGGSVCEGEMRWFTSDPWPTTLTL